MKLYVWNNPYDVAFGGSCAYAVADSEDEARALVEAASAAQYGHEPKGSSEGAKVPGPPDRVHELPYAEIYEWSE